MFKKNIQYSLACKISADGDEICIPIYASTLCDCEDYDLLKVVEFTKNIFSKSSSHIIYEIHQYLANNGFSSLVFLVNKVDSIKLIPCTTDFSGNAQCLIISGDLPTSKNYEITVNVFYAFLYLVSQGREPEDIDSYDITYTIEYLSIQ